MQPLLASLFDETERRPVTVSELTQSIRGELEKRFASALFFPFVFSVKNKGS